MATQHAAETTAKKLATPTDLSTAAVHAITDALNPLTADAFALYVKTKNFHWHISGPHFRDYHLLLDEQADQIFASIDLLAERVRRIGGTSLHSIGQISRLQTIKDDNEEFVPALDMLRRLREDNSHMAQAMRAANEVCEKYKDVATSNILETLIDETEKRTWFLFEAIQSA